MNLRALQEKDAPLMLEWMKDPDVNQYFRFNADKMNMDTVKEFIRSSGSYKDTFHFAIVDKNDEYFGTVSLKNIDNEAKSGEYAIALRSGCQGKGAGNFATQEILSFAFNNLKLERVYLNVFSDNLHAIKFYEKSGFVFEGEFYNHINIKGKFKSLKWYRMMRCEYDNRKL